MSTTTTNFNLIKPELTDAADITAFNSNWDKIDTELANITKPVTASSSDGVAYTATVKNLTGLYAGLLITIIPNMNSASTTPTLNVNGFGVKNIRQPLTTNTIAVTSPTLTTWMRVGKPVQLQYDGTQWKAIDLPAISANNLYGQVPITGGGTGADNADDALNNLGAAKVNHSHTANDLPTIPIEKGGTGATTAKEAQNNLGIITLEELPNLYIWTKFSGNPSLVETEKTKVVVSKSGGSDGGTHDSIDYADEISVKDGIISLVNPTTIDIATKDLMEETLGKYIYSHYTKKHYFIPSTATVSQTGTSTYGLYLEYSSATELTFEGEKIGFVASRDKTTYPTNGEHTDGMWYVYRKQLGE